MKKKEILRRGWGLFNIYFSTDKTLGTGYDIHHVRVMIADHVTLLAISLLHFWARLLESGLNLRSFFRFTLRMRVKL